MAIVYIFQEQSSMKVIFTGDITRFPPYIQAKMAYISSYLATLYKSNHRLRLEQDFSH